MTENKQISAQKLHKKYTFAKWLATAFATSTLFLGFSNHKQANRLRENSDREADRSHAHLTQMADLQKRLHDAQQRAQKAEKLNQQAWTVLADATPAYTLTGECEDPQTKSENAAERKRYEKACKELGINPQKLSKLRENLVK